MKKFTSVIIALAMLCALMTSMIQTASAAWDGSTVSAGLIGTGSEIDPYLVSSENDLAYVAKQVNDGTTSYAGEFIKLTVDLDLGNKPWSPIGLFKSFPFAGTFDGDGHTISNLTVKTGDDTSNTIHGGVFGLVKDGIIKNLTVENANIVSLKYGGAVAGQLNCTADGGYCAIINCHVNNAEIRGLQIGGVVGRSSQSKASKGQLEIIGCTANNLTFAPLADADFPTISYTNHFIGGIAGGAGATVITGCGVTNMTALAYGTSFAPVGGILGVQGADSCAADVTNCYAIGINLSARSDSHPTKSQLGGLIGKMAHVAVNAGDPNTEYNVFNCFVSDVTLKNESGSLSSGVVVGLVNDTIFFNDVYYVPSEGLEAYGEDKYYSDYPFMKIAALSEVNAATLNAGNSTAVWVDDTVKGYPIIDSAAAEANEPAYIDYYVENEAQTTLPDTDLTSPDTTEKPEETTKPDEATEAPATDAPTEAPVTTEAPVATDAPDTEAPAEKGCGGMIAGGAVIIALIGVAFVSKKRN